MAVIIHDSFLSDLHAHGDSAFAQRAIRKLLNPNGTFRSDGQDHRYDGIDDAWIRYISGGNTAWRAIYLRKGADIHLYRAGEHSIENNLVAPNGFEKVATVKDGSVGYSAEGNAADLPETGNRFRQNGRKRLLRSFFLKRRLIPHKEVILVSPQVSQPLFASTSKFGDVIDQLIEDKTKVCLITSRPDAVEVDFFHSLEVRGIDVLFVSNVNAKLYMFTVRQGEMYGDDHEDAALIGSSDLTERGLGFDDQTFNEELCYELPKAAHADAMSFVYDLLGQAVDLISIRRDLKIGK